MKKLDKVDIAVLQRLQQDVRLTKSLPKSWQSVNPPVGGG